MAFRLKKVFDKAMKKEFPVLNEDDDDDDFFSADTPRSRSVNQKKGPKRTSSPAVVPRKPRTKVG